MDVKGYGAGPEAKLQWRFGDSRQAELKSLKPDLDTVAQRFSKSDLTEGGFFPVTATLDEVGKSPIDKLPIDDAHYRIIEVAADLKVLIVEGDRASSSISVDTALLPKSDEDRGSHSYVRPQVISDLELGGKILSDYRAVILANVGSIAAPQADRLRQFVANGGELMIFMGGQVNADAYNSILYSRKLLPGKLITRKTSATSGFTFDYRPNTASRQLDIFKGDDQSGLNTIPIQTYFQMEIDPQLTPEIVLSYLAGEKETHDPAITVHRLDRGSVITITTSANSEWNSLPQCPAYPALVHELLSRNVEIADRWMNLQVGQVLEVPASIKPVAPMLYDPKQHQIVLEPANDDTGRVAFRSKALENPGLYTLQLHNQKALKIAVNVPADEADIRVLARDQIPPASGRHQPEHLLRRGPAGGGGRP